MRISALLAHVAAAWAPCHRTPPARRAPLRAETDYLASLVSAPSERGPGRRRRAWRWLRGTLSPRGTLVFRGMAPVALSADEVLGLVVLGHARAEAEAMAPRRARRLLAQVAAAPAEVAAPVSAAPAAAPAETKPWCSKGRTRLKTTAIRGAAAPPPAPPPAAATAALQPPAAATPPPPAAAAPPVTPPAEAPPDALTPDEILRLVVLGRSRADAAALDPVQARRELAAVVEAPPSPARFDVRDATDEELWSLAKAEVAGPRAEARDEAVAAQLERSWPDLDTFTELLTRESLRRLEVLGPQFAEPLKTEARWRRKVYGSWLRLVDGAGVLPGPGGDLAYGEALFDPNGGLPAEAPDAVKAAFVRLYAERAELRGARRDLDAWERRALPDR